MALRTGHGTGAGTPRVEVLPASELPAGVPDQAAPVARRQNGQVASAASARALGRQGGLKSAQRRADAKAYGAQFGLGRRLEFNADTAVAPFVAEGEEWLAAQCVAVARDVGGGRLSPGVVSILRTAAWERLYAALYFDLATRTHFAFDVVETDEAGNPKRIRANTELALVAARLGDSSRQNLLAAHELAAREAKARPPDRTLLPVGFVWSEEEEPKKP